MHMSSIPPLPLLKQGTPFIPRFKDGGFQTILDVILSRLRSIEGDAGFQGDRKGRRGPSICTQFDSTSGTNVPIKRPLPVA